jgi:iron-sulfur cluster repair protein YtfE (RIC family)
MISIGKRSGGGDLVELLLECHARIRSFAALARAAGELPGASAAERIDACAQVARYFGEALPLHVADEEHSLLPRLRGRDPELDAALQRMHDQHADHESALRHMLAAAATLRATPDDPTARATLATAATDLERAFAEHLDLEEAVIFPAIRRLPASVQSEIVAELRARRR